MKEDEEKWRRMEMEDEKDGRGWRRKTNRMEEEKEDEGGWRRMKEEDEKEEDEKEEDEEDEGG